MAQGGRQLPTLRFAGRDRIMKELAKTDEGQARIAAAAARLDMTVSELGQRHQVDVPQGEMERMGHHQPESPPHFCQ